MKVKKIHPKHEIEKNQGAKEKAKCKTTKLYNKVFLAFHKQIAYENQTRAPLVT